MKIIHDEQNFKFYILDNEDMEVAELLYSIDHSNKSIKLKSTWVEEEYRNQNLATTLTESLVDYAILNDSKIVPICSFGKVFFKRYRDKYKDIIFFE